MLDEAHNRRSGSGTVLITGGLGDIGWATALKFAADGWKVAINDLLPQREGESRVERAGSGSRVRYWEADNRDRPAVDRMVAEIEAAFGALGIAIVNAAIVEPVGFLEMS